MGKRKQLYYFTYFRFDIVCVFGFSICVLLLCCIYSFAFVGVFDGSVGFWAFAFWFSRLIGTSVGMSARRPVFLGDGVDFVRKTAYHFFHSFFTGGDSRVDKVFEGGGFRGDVVELHGDRLCGGSLQAVFDEGL